VSRAGVGEGPSIHSRRIAMRCWAPRDPICRPKDLIKTNLKHVINGTRVIVSGTCRSTCLSPTSRSFAGLRERTRRLTRRGWRGPTGSTYPCTKDGWRCQQCISSLEEKYQRIILELQEEHKSADAEVFERRAQMVEMRKVLSPPVGPYPPILIPPQITHLCPPINAYLFPMAPSLGSNVNYGPIESDERADRSRRSPIS